MLSACGSGSQSSLGGPGSPLTLRLGFLTNLTHAGALVGLKEGLLRSELPAGVTLGTQAFNAGPSEVEALLGGALDAAFIGPSPAVNAFVKTRGQAVRIVAGAASGGAGLVLRKGLHPTSPAGLEGLTLATPELGNTQDVALRAYLAAHGLHTNPQGGGDVRIVPTANATALRLLQEGKIDGAWEPEPWTSTLVVEGGGTLFVDEASLWPQGRFATTELIVTARLLSSRPDVVTALLRGHLRTTDWIQQHPDAARADASAELETLTHAALPQTVLTPAWSHLTFTVDPLAASLDREAADARRAGLLSSASLEGIVDLRPLNSVLRAAGQPPVASAGLGPA